MKMIMEVSMPPEAFNDAVRDGSADQKLGSIMEHIKPEAAYFTTINGRRGGYLIVNLEDTSRIPSLAEPWFLHFNATVVLKPCMTPEDLQRSGLKELGQQWG